MPTEPTSTSRHPWLELLLADPERECKRLLDRVADVGDYSRAEPDEILRMLVGDLDGDDPVIMALDKGFLAWVEASRQDHPASDRARNLQTLKAADAFRAISAVSGPVLLDYLWKNYITYYHWADSNSTSVIDLRYEFLSMLSQSQARLREAKRDRTPMWLTLCGNAGRSIPDRYLDIGLIGLRRATRLPPAEQEGAAISPEEYGMIGLGKWVEQRSKRDVGNELARKWAVIKLSYPHNDAFWRDAFERLLLPRDPNLASRVLKDWAEALGLKNPNSVPQAADIVHVVPALKPGQNWKTTKQAIYTQIAGQVRRVMRGGPTLDLARAVTMLGNDALKRAGTDAANVALELAMVGLTWEPQNAFCWSLWRDALATAGDYAGAETIGLEGARRNPGNPAMWTGLTKLWMSRAMQRRQNYGRTDEEAKSLFKRAADVLGDTWQRSGNSYALTMGANALNKLGDVKTAKKLLKKSVDEIDISKAKHIPIGWKAEDVIVVRNMYSKSVLYDNPGLNDFLEAERLSRATIVYAQGNNVREQIEFAQSILIGALIGINEPEKLSEAISLCRILKTDESTKLLRFLERETQDEPPADDETNISNVESSIFEPEFESSEGQDDVETRYGKGLIGHNILPDAYYSLVESESMIAAPIPYGVVSKAITPTDSEIDAGSSYSPSRVRQSLPPLIGSLDPDFQSKSQINVDSLSDFAKRFSRAIDPNEYPNENNEWDAFSNFMLKGFQAWNSEDDPGIDFPASTTSFALALTSAIHRGDQEQMMGLAVRFPQEHVVCKLAVARANSDPDAILKIVASHKRQANAAGSTLGSASRAVVSMITKDSVDAFMGEDDQILPLALASTFDIPLAA